MRNFVRQYRNIPNTDESESIKRVLVVPSLFNPCKKKYRDAAKPTIPSNNMYGISIKLMLSGMPNDTVKARRIIPSIKDFSCIIFVMSILWLSILLILLSNPQNKVAPMISKFPAFIFSSELSNCRFVVTMITPIRTKAIAIYPIRFSFSPNNVNANSIEKIISPFDKSELSIAVVNLRPKKNIAGAIAAPEIDVISKSR